MACNPTPKVMSRVVPRFWPIVAKRGARNMTQVPPMAKAKPVAKADQPTTVW